MDQFIRTYRLSADPAGTGLCCNPEGLTLGGIPLLLKGDFGFEPRPSREVESLLDAAYRKADAEFGTVLAGIWTAAKALNDGDLPLAMIASVLTRLPELDGPGMARLRFMDSLLKANFNVLEPRDEGGRWTSSGARDGALPAPNDDQHSDPNGNDQRFSDNLVPVQYRGDYHDQVVGELFRAIIADGGIAIKEVPFKDFLGNVTRLDLLVIHPKANPPLFGIEVKTGPGAKYTFGQAAVYPQIVIGGSVSSLDPRLPRFGLDRGARLPPIFIWTYWKPAPDEDGIWIPVIPEFQKLLSTVFFFVEPTNSVHRGLL